MGAPHPNITVFSSLCQLLSPFIFTHALENAIPLIYAVLIADAQQPGPIFPGTFFHESRH